MLFCKFEKVFRVKITKEHCWLANIQCLSKAAFTLAEVLITLGVIGIVAAMTMPALMTDYKNKVYDSQLNKAKTVMTNAIKNMMANEMVFDIDNIPLSNCGTNVECINAEYNKVLKILDNSINSSFENKYCSLNYKTGDEEVSFCGDYAAILADGTLFSHEFVEIDSVASVNNNIFARILNWLFSPVYAASKVLVLGIDLNGAKIPNELNKDLRIFNVAGNGRLTDVTKACSEGAGTCGHYVPVSNCTPDDYSSCTQEQCSVLSYGNFQPVWRNNTCYLCTYDTQGQCYDKKDEKEGYGWDAPAF